MTNPTTALALVVAASALALLPGVPAQAVGTCHGQPATIEATSGTVTGTDGPDVIIAGGTVDQVLAGDGDDLVCVVGVVRSPEHGFYVDGEGGADVVDASAAGDSVSAGLLSGADTYTGSVHGDYVTVGTVGATLEEPGDPGPFHVSTGGGGDWLATHVGALVEADLGAGGDALSAKALAEGSRIDMGDGQDHAELSDDWEDRGSGETTLSIDLVAGLVAWHDASSTLLGAEGVTATARVVHLRGTRLDNSMTGYGCYVVIRGRAGDDRISVATHPRDHELMPFTCHGFRRRAFGDRGDDDLRGGVEHDVLIGGRGYDRAFGGPGARDVCRAEWVRGPGCTG